MEITKKEIKHLAELGRLELSEKEEKKLQKNLGEIVSYFNELKNLKISREIKEKLILANVAEEDEGKTSQEISKIREQFSDRKDDYLKIPPVF